MKQAGWASRFLAAVVLTWSGAAAAAADPSAESGPDGRTPPRLSYTEGRVSYWRPGAPDWVGAPLNVPLAADDELYTGPDGTLEVQVGPRAWARAWAATSIGVGALEPDYLQLKVTNGHVALDVRALEPGHTLEIATPSAAFTVERAGYYRVGVTAERTSLIVRRGGSALATPASGAPTVVAASQELVVEGGSAPAATLSGAADLDPWDHWNYARTDALSAAVSARYVSPGVYGTADLDRHGTWQVAETYGSVWIPRGVPAGWAPYTTGTWVRDPYYGWTWVDSAPWGWAPYHYGRWVHLRSGWAWAPGPVVARAVYAPALVAFFSGPGHAIRVGPPAVGWCALGWGEPIVPWWGRPGFAGVPSWRGWGGPRVVNTVVVRNTTVVDARQITVYTNQRVKDAVVSVAPSDFGGRRVGDVRLRPADIRHVEPARPPVAATAASLVPATAGAAAITPPRDVIARSVVGTPREPGRSREPNPAREPNTPREPGRGVAPRAAVEPPAAVVPPARVEPPAVRMPRAPDGAATVRAGASPRTEPLRASSIGGPPSPAPATPDPGGLGRGPDALRRDTLDRAARDRRSTTPAPRPIPIAEPPAARPAVTEPARAARPTSQAIPMTPATPRDITKRDIIRDDSPGRARPATPVVARPDRPALGRRDIEPAVTPSAPVIQAPVPRQAPTVTPAPSPVTREPRAAIRAPVDVPRPALRAAEPKAQPRAGATAPQRAGRGSDGAEAAGPRGPEGAARGAR